MCRNKSKQSKKTKNNNSGKFVNSFCYECSKDELVNIQTEAYYRAMKRIEKEKEKKILEEKQKLDKIKKEKWYINLLFFMNTIFWPFKIHKRFKINEHVYDNLLLVAVSLMLEVAGGLCWLFGILITVGCAIFIKSAENLSVLALSIWGVFLGSFLIISGNEFSKESDSSKIYAYSASIFAFASCIIGMIALMK